MQNQQRANRNQISTNATIFSDESDGKGGKNQNFAFQRNAGQEQIQKYKSHYLNLQIFLQFYKEKLMLTKKMHDSLDKHVVTIEQLQKEKEGYSDQF